MPPLAKSLLGLSRKFIPTERFSQGPRELDEGLNRFDRDAHIKAFFAGSPLDNNPPPLYVPSIWRPPPGSVPQELDDRLYRFYKRLRNLFKKRRGVANLLPFQIRLMAWLKRHPHWVVANTDKNLGPCIIELERYIRDALAHFQDAECYEFLTKEEADMEAQKLANQIFSWTVAGRNARALSDMDVKYIRSHTGQNLSDPHGYFYLMYKVHKKVLGTRPVCSDCASVTNPLGQWVDIMLQPVAQSMPTYFKDSFAFKELIDNLHVPPGATIATCDAVAMYPNIPTNIALGIICPWLRDNEHRFEYHATTLITALEIVMTNNILRLGNVYVKQISGTAMGKPPAPPWATIFEGIHEIDFLPRWTSNLLIYKRFIDDVFLVWVPSDPATDAQNWCDFQAEVNNNHLTWEFTKRSLSENFLDLTIAITPQGSLKTTLYEKPMALHLFIPPHSAHPPNVLAGHINGNILRIFRLNTKEEDIIEDTVRFFHRFLRRGHNRDTLEPLFLKAIENARKFLATSQGRRDAMKAEKNRAASERLYLHIKYHPQNPSSAKIQRLFHETILCPPGKEPIYEIENWCGHKIPIKAMIIANHRAPNLGDKFSYRDISKRNGPPASSYL